MKRIALLMSILALALVSAAPAFAQDPNLVQGDAPCSEFVGQEKDQCLGALQEFDAESNPTGVQASASASATASASAAASQYQYNAQDQYNAGAQYDQGPTTLPLTGGFNLPLALGVLLLVCGIWFGSHLYIKRRHQ